MADKEVVQRIYDQGTHTRPTSFVGKAIIRALLDYGATEDEALWAYQSKHVRWFFDGANKPYGKTGRDTYKMFSNYIAKNANGIQDDIGWCPDITY